MFIWLTSKTNAVPVRPTGPGECPVCRCERPFTLVVRYRATRFYSTFGWVSSREYLRLCDICGQGGEAAVDAATAGACNAAIPYMERRGCLVFVLIFVACLAFALVAGSQ